MLEACPYLSCTCYSPAMACAGKPVAFKLMPANTQPLLAVPGSTAYTRAGFARNSLWVTQANDSHRWPGGDYPLQNPNPGGLQDWVEEVRHSCLPMELAGALPQKHASCTCTCLPL